MAKNDRILADDRPEFGHFLAILATFHASIYLDFWKRYRS